MLFLGVDPGASGAAVVLDQQRAVFGHISFQLREPASAAIAVKAFIDATRSKSGYDIAAAVENVHALPLDGARAAFAFGRSIGAVEAALAMCGVRIIRVAPQVWQRLALAGRPRRTRQERKRSARAAAADRWPDQIDIAGNDGLADAALIADWLTVAWTAGKV